MFKTMWKMPAKLMRLDADGAADGDPVASGSLEDMIKAADSFGSDEGGELIIACAGRDRPITWAEIKGLRHASTFPVEA